MRPEIKAATSLSAQPFRYKSLSINKKLQNVWNKQKSLEFSECYKNKLHLKTFKTLMKILHIKKSFYLKIFEESYA